MLGICIYNLANYYKKLAVNCVTARDIYELKVYPKSSVLSFWFALHSWYCAIDSWTQLKDNVNKCNKSHQKAKDLYKTSRNQNYKEKL